MQQLSIFHQVKVITNANGTKRWYLNGERHREDGPAIEYADGNKYWYLNGKLHRDGGPAVECHNGDKHWYLNGKELSEEDYQVEIERRRRIK